ncbi:hypothetical protein ACR0ST_04410 [Aliidiomarina sp. Khilg15.8]
MADLPSEFPIKEVHIQSIEPTWREEAENLEVSVRSKNAQRFNVTLRSTKVKKQQGRILFGLLHELTAGAAFTAVLPGYTDRPNGIAGGAPSVRTDAPVGQKYLELQGGLLNQVGQHQPGDYFRVSGHQKVYLVTRVANTNGQGQTTIHFRPGLKQAVSSTTQLILHDVAMTLRLRRDPIEFTANSRDGELTSYELDCYEDVR